MHALSVRRPHTFGRRWSDIRPWRAAGARATATPAALPPAALPPRPAGPTPAAAPRWRPGGLLWCQTHPWGGPLSCLSTELACAQPSPAPPGSAAAWLPAAGTASASSARLQSWGGCREGERHGVSRQACRGTSASALQSSRRLLPCAAASRCMPPARVSCRAWWVGRQQPLLPRGGKEGVGQLRRTDAVQPRGACRRMGSECLRFGASAEAGWVCTANAC